MVTENDRVISFFFCSVPGSAPLESRAIARAPDGEGCPRCGGFVYAAEQMLALGKVSTVSMLEIVSDKLTIEISSLYVDVSSQLLQLRSMP
jgi:hypothetical protein